MHMDTLWSYIITTLTFFVKFLGGTCPYLTADISHYQNDHNKSSNIKDGFVD